MGLRRDKSQATDVFEPAHIERVTTELDAAFASAGRSRQGRTRNRGVYKKLPAIVAADETIVVVGQAQFTESVWTKNDKWFKGGYLVLTDRRLIALGTGFGGSGGTRGFEAVPLEHVLSVDNSRLSGTIAEPVQPTHQIFRALYRSRRRAPRALTCKYAILSQQGR